MKIISIPCIRAGTTIQAVASSDFLKMGNEVKEKTERERERAWVIFICDGMAHTCHETLHRNLHLYALKKQ
jgi:hypothetical protein